VLLVLAMMMHIEDSELLRRTKKQPRRSVALKIFYKKTATLEFRVADL
jgi:hypothetical protein